MLSLNLLTISEYKPVHKQNVTIFTADKSWLPIVSIVPKFMRCEVHFQMYDAEDDHAVPSWCCYDPDTQSDIPFHVPVVFESEPIEGNDKVQKITGWHLASEDELESIKHAPDENERFYYKKEFFFTDDRSGQIDHTDQYNEVLGIIDTKHFNEQLMGNMTNASIN